MSLFSRRTKTRTFRYRVALKKGKRYVSSKHTTIALARKKAGKYGKIYLAKTGKRVY